MGGNIVSTHDTRGGGRAEAAAKRPPQGFSATGNAIRRFPSADKVGDPGLEPGASALSERRSNRLS